MNNNLVEFTNLFKQSYGLDISIFNEAFLENTIQTRMQVKSLINMVEYQEFLKNDNVEIQLLRDSLQIHYSEFFRVPLTFAMLEYIILPDLVQKRINEKRKEIRIWSAGCAAGQEPYSIAILMEELLTGENQKLNYRIFATDLDEKQLEIGRIGEYNPNALGKVSLNRTKTWFSKKGENYVILPSLQEKIEFTENNLLKEGKICPPSSIFGDFDLVFCSNLMIYYKPSFQNRILKKFEECIIQDGYLVSDLSEKAIVLRSGYKEVFPQTPIFQRNI